MLRWQTEWKLLNGSTDFVDVSWAVRTHKLDLHASFFTSSFRSNDEVSINKVVQVWFNLLLRELVYSDRNEWIEVFEALGMQKYYTNTKGSISFRGTCLQVTTGTRVHLISMIKMKPSPLRIPYLISEQCFWQVFPLFVAPFSVLFSFIANSLRIRPVVGHGYNCTVFLFNNNNVQEEKQRFKQPRKKIKSGDENYYSMRRRSMKFEEDEEYERTVCKRKCWK